MSEVVRLMPAYKRIQHLEMLLTESQGYVAVLIGMVESLAQILDEVAAMPTLPLRQRAHLMRILAQTRGIIAKVKQTEAT